MNHQLARMITSYFVCSQFTIVVSTLLLYRAIRKKGTADAD